MLSSTRRQLSKSKTLGLLATLGIYNDPASTIYIPADQATVFDKDIICSALDIKEPPEGLYESITRSSTGAVIFWGEQHKYLVLPPFPISFEGTLKGYHVGPLRAFLVTDYTIALVLIRLGTYAIGIFKGERLLSSKVGKGLVHSRHRKGGSSARRFERHRDKQIEILFTRVCNHVREKLQPYVYEINYLIYGGERNTINSFRKQCDFLKKVDNRTVEHLLNIREPGQASLEASIEEAWSSTVLQWTAG